MIDAVKLRRQVRVVLGSSSDEVTVPEAYIHAGLSDFFPRGERIPVDEMLAALAWNEARGWCARRRNPEMERNEWLLTPQGRAREGIA